MLTLFSTACDGPGRNPNYCFSHAQAQIIKSTDTTNYLKSNYWLIKYSLNVEVSSIEKKVNSKK